MTTQTPTSQPAATGPAPAAGMSAAGTATAPPVTGASGNAPISSGEQQARNPTGGWSVTVSEEQWESERQLVDSLAKLQELEAKVRIWAGTFDLKDDDLLTRLRFINCGASFQSVC